MTLSAPPSVRHEHDHLHARLARAERTPGRLGEAARTVARILHPHFLREDEYATPPLALLHDLAHGHYAAAMSSVLPLVQRLRQELPLMLEEHQAILGALDELAGVARDVRDDDLVRLAEELKLHAQLEEEVLYPAALLVGDYVQLRMRG
ncbi:MAG TPA: hypothetical protein VF970_06670 [Gemmatimonadales bacterium]